MAFTKISCGIYQDGKRLSTVDQSVSASKDREFRTWDPHHSKLAALILKGFMPPITESSVVLYLGAASGSTASHVSDITRNGLVYALEFSPRVMKNLILACESRPNMIPIFADANHPEKYSYLVDKVDVIYQDISQRNQAEIALKNMRCFLKDEGCLIFMIKARSIDTIAKTRAIFGKEVEKLQEGASVLKTVKLPQYRDHLAVIATKL